MSLVICPECKKEISEYAENCPNCGFPLKNFLEQNHIVDISKIFICPKCGEMSFSPYYIPFVCDYCESVFLQTNIDRNEYRQIKNNIFTENGKGNSGSKAVDEYNKALSRQYGKDQFDETMFDNRIQKRDADLLRSSTSSASTKTTNTPKCPTCGSTNIEKISLTKKAVGAFGFGLFSKTAKSQFHCKDCGYKW